MTRFSPCQATRVPHPSAALRTGFLAAFARSGPFVCKGVLYKRPWFPFREERERWSTQRVGDLRVSNMRHPEAPRFHQRGEGSGV